MMRLHDIAIIACVLPAQFAVLRTHEQLRLWTPGKRIVTGLAGMLAAVAVLLLGTLVLPRPPAPDASLPQDLVVGGYIGLVAVISVLSGMQIAGGSVQALQRWRYHRRISVRHR